MSRSASSSPSTASGAMLPGSRPGMEAGLPSAGSVAASGSRMVTCCWNCSGSAPAVRALSSSTIFLESTAPGLTVGAIIASSERVPMMSSTDEGSPSSSAATTVAASSLTSTSCIWLIRSSISSSGRAAFLEANSALTSVTRVGAWKSLASEPRRAGGGADLACITGLMSRVAFSGDLAAPALEPSSVALSLATRSEVASESSASSLALMVGRMASGGSPP